MKKKESFKLFIWIVFITMVIGYPIYSVFAVPLTIENNVSTTNLCSTIHPNLVGNSGKWFANKSDANKYGRQAVASEDYDKLGGDVYGYECWSCPNCEKWTVNFIISI